MGTTNSAVAIIIEAGEPKVREKRRRRQNYAFHCGYFKSGDRLVGLLAKRQAVTNPENTVYSVKRLIGRKFEDEEVKKTKNYCPTK